MQILVDAVPKIAAACAILLMGVCGVSLLRRLIRVAQGRADACRADQLQAGVCVKGVLAAMAAALLSRLVIYVVAWGMYRLSGGNEGLLAS